jgi:hypothetical protein
MQPQIAVACSLDETVAEMVWNAGRVTPLPWKGRGSLAIAKDWLETMLLERNGVSDWGSAMVTTQKMYSPTNPDQVSKTPCAMTVAQIDQALRDFILQDTAHLRRDAETATPETSQREPEAPQMVSEFVRQMAGTRRSWISVSCAISCTPKANE